MAGSPEVARPVAPSGPTTPRPPRSPGAGTRTAGPRWTLVRLAVAAALVGLSLLGSVSERLLDVDYPGLGSLLRWFDLDTEGGVPTWFATVLLFLCAQAMWRLSERSAAGARARWVRHEQALAGVFVYLSVDEATQIHERANGVLRGLRDVSPVLAFPWVVLAVPAAVLVAVLMLGWLRALPTRTRTLLLLSGAVYVTGAAGLEVVEALIWSDGGKESFTYALVYTLEEALEMAALILFLRTAPRIGAREPALT